MSGAIHNGHWMGGYSTTPGTCIDVPVQEIFLCRNGCSANLTFQRSTGQTVRLYPAARTHSAECRAGLALVLIASKGCRRAVQTAVTGDARWIEEQRR